MFKFCFLLVCSLSNAAARSRACCTGVLRAVSARPERGTGWRGPAPSPSLWEAGGLCGPSRLDRGCAVFSHKKRRRSVPEPPAAYRVKQKRRPLPFGSHRRIVHPLICHNEEAPPQVSSQPCNSTVLAPRKPLCPNGFHVHDLPSQERCSQWRCYPGSVCCFGHLLALTVPSAVGFWPKIPSKLLSDDVSSLQQTAARRPRA